MLTATQTSAFLKTDFAKFPERRLKLAGALVDLLKVRPHFVSCLGEPTSGIIRRGADACVLDGNGNMVRGDGPGGMRDALGIGKVVDAIRGWEKQFQPAQVWSGLGNIKMNRGCLAWEAGRLHFSLQDAASLAEGKCYHGCVFWKDGTASFERVSFVPQDTANQWQPVIHATCVGEKIDLIVTGQRLIERGQPIDPASDPSAADEFVDKRHLLRNAYVPLRDGMTWEPVLVGAKADCRDFGLDQLMRDPDKLTAAIQGRIVELDLAVWDIDQTFYHVDAADLRLALLAKSYEECGTQEDLVRRSNDGDRGVFLIDQNRSKCLMVYSASPYPHHMLLQRRNGDRELYDIAGRGFSNNGGFTISDILLDARRSGFTEALLLDQGGDSVLVARHHGNGVDWPEPNGECALIPSSLRRTQWAAALLYSGDVSAIRLAQDETGADGSVPNRRQFTLHW